MTGLKPRSIWTNGTLLVFTAWFFLGNLFWCLDNDVLAIIVRQPERCESQEERFTITAVRDCEHATVKTSETCNEGKFSATTARWREITTVIVQVKFGAYNMMRGYINPPSNLMHVITFFFAFPQVNERHANDLGWKEIYLRLRRAIMY